MLFQVLPFHGAAKISNTIPFHLRQYALKHARVRYMQLPEGEVLSQQITGKNFSIWVHHFFLTKDISLHAITEQLCRTINYTRKGSLFCEMVNTGEVHLREGYYHFFCVPPNLLHTCHFTAGDYCFLHLDMTEDLLTQIDYNPQCKNALQTYYKDPEHKGIQLEACGIDPMVNDIIQLIGACRYEDKAKYDAYILFQVLRLLNEFNTEMARYMEAEEKRKKEQQHQKASEKRLEQLFPYINSHLGKKLDMKTLSQLFEVSSSTLKRYIDEQLRTTLSGYVLDARMQKGRQLLREGKKVIGKIADSLGYAQCSSFARAYRKRFGCSPTEERLLYKGIKE